MALEDHIGPLGKLIEAARHYGNLEERLPHSTTANMESRIDNAMVAKEREVAALVREIKRLI